MNKSVGMGGQGFGGCVGVFEEGGVWLATQHRTVLAERPCYAKAAPASCWGKVAEPAVPSCCLDYYGASLVPDCHLGLEAGNVAGPNTIATDPPCPRGALSLSLLN